MADVDKGTSKFFRLPGLPPVLSDFAVGLVVLTVLALLTWQVCVHVLHLTALPYGYYLLISNGDDLPFFKPRFAHLHSVDFFAPQYGTPWNYPPLVAPFYAAFYLFRHPTPEFIGVGVSLMVVLGVLLLRSLRRRGIRLWPAVCFIVVSAVFSYPLYFEFSRGNMEIFNWLLAGLGVYLVLSGREWLGAAFIGLAGAFKLYPMIYVGVLIARRKYWQTVFAVVVAGVASVASFRFISPDVAYGFQVTRKALHDYTGQYAAHYLPVYPSVDHAIFALIKRIIGPLPAHGYNNILAGYMATVAVGGTLVFFLRMRKLPVINQVLCLTICAIILPPLSFDYTLLHMYTPWALLVMMAVDQWHASPEQSDRVLVWMFAGMTILMAQIGEVILHGERLGAQIKCVTMLAMLGLALWKPLRSRFDDEPQRVTAN